jgi:hypothetical protein
LRSSFRLADDLEIGFGAQEVQEPTADDRVIVDH